MACYHPLKAFYSNELTASGKRTIVFNENQGESKLTLACGQCLGCRTTRSKNWAVRIMHEAAQHPQNSFITLTYAPEHLPKNGQLVKRDFQNFMKSLRKSLNDPTGKRFIGPRRLPHYIRYFHCGEYGDRGARPHYHACLFNLDFPDKIFYKRENDNDLFHSPSLAAIWKKGFVTVGELTYKSAAYVARYIFKKVTGRLAQNHYSVEDPETGEILDGVAEYVTMSRRPGIAHAWFQKFKSDFYTGDFVLMNGKKHVTPKFYLNLLEKEAPELFRDIKEQREVSQQKQSPDNTPERLATREFCHRQKLKPFKRNFESGI